MQYSTWFCALIVIKLLHPLCNDATFNSSKSTDFIYICECHLLSAETVQFVFPSDVHLCLWMLPCGNFVVQQIWYVAKFTAETPLLTYYKCYVNSWYQFSAENYLLFPLLCWKLWTKYSCGTWWCQQVHAVVLHKRCSLCYHSYPQQQQQHVHSEQWYHTNDHFILHTACH